MWRNSTSSVLGMSNCSCGHWWNHFNWVYPRGNTTTDQNVMCASLSYSDLLNFVADAVTTSEPSSQVQSSLPTNGGKGCFKYHSHLAWPYPVHFNNVNQRFASHLCLKVEFLAWRLLRTLVFWVLKLWLSSTPAAILFSEPRERQRNLPWPKRLYYHFATAFNDSEQQQ